MQSDLFFPSTRSPASFPPDGGPFPFRAEPRTTTDAEIEQENRRNAFKGARAYLPVPDAERIARSARSMSFARLHALLHHPDERVPVAMTANPQAFTSDTSTRFGETSKYIRDALYLRAMQEAEEEGVHWTPLLDALADRNL